MERVEKREVRIGGESEREDSIERDGWGRTGKISTEKETDRHTEGER